MFAKTSHSEFLKTASLNRFNSFQNPKQLCCFANSSRQNFPSWALRISRDKNDLIYQSNYNLIKGKNDLLHKLPDKSKIIKNEKQRKKKLQHIEEQIQKHMKSTQKLNNDLFEKKQGRDQDTIDPTDYKYYLINNMQTRKQNQTLFIPKQADNFNIIQTNTIRSDIMRKSSHHLRFQKQPDRPINIYQIIYNKDNQNNGDPLHPKLKSQKSIHPFRSNSGHKVFQPAQSLDKFYDVTQKQFQTKYNRSVSGVQFQKRSSIQKLKIDAHEPPAFTRLDYEYQSGQRIMRPNIKTYDMQKYKRRQLKFTKQIINPRRGCSR